MKAASRERVRREAPRCRPSRAPRGRPAAARPGPSAQAMMLYHVIAQYSVLYYSEVCYIIYIYIEREILIY